MLICAAGDCHGKIRELYEIVFRLEEETGRQVDLVVQVGDYGIWPDPNKLDRATRNRGQGGDFAQWWQERRAVPRPTLFIAGNHEDFDFLTRPSGTRDILPGLTFLQWGDVHTFDNGTEQLRIGGVGGCFSLKDYSKSVVLGSGRRHYLRRELQEIVRQCQPRLDILMLHDAPAGPIIGITSPGKSPPRRFSQSEGLAELITAVQPRICLTGHFHVRSERVFSGVRTVGMGLVPHRGSAILMEFSPGEDSPVDVVEWGGRASSLAPPVSVNTTPLTLSLPEPVRLLVERVEQWAREVLQGTSLTREQRVRAFSLLADLPHGRILVSALKSGQRSGDGPSEAVRRSVEKSIRAEDRETVLKQWQAGALPDPEAFRLSL